MSLSDPNAVHGHIMKQNHSLWWISCSLAYDHIMKRWRCLFITQRRSGKLQLWLLTEIQSVKTIQFASSLKQTWTSIKGWLAGWMDEWLACCLAGWSGGWMDGWIFSWVDGWMDEWMVGGMNGRIDWSVDWSISQLNNRSIGQLMNWLVGWLNDWLIK